MKIEITEDPMTGCMKIWGYTGGLLGPGILIGYTQGNTASFRNAPGSWSTFTGETFDITKAWLRKKAEDRKRGVKKGYSYEDGVWYETEEKSVGSV